MHVAFPWAHVPLQLIMGLWDFTPRRVPFAPGACGDSLGARLLLQVHVEIMHMEWKEIHKMGACERRSGTCERPHAPEASPWAHVVSLLSEIF